MPMTVSGVTIWTARRQFSHSLDSRCARRSRRAMHRDSRPYQVARRHRTGPCAAIASASFDRCASSSFSFREQPRH
jgi:hypothetical protein